MATKIEVHKFGGGVLINAKAIIQMVYILKNFILNQKEKSFLIVISAFGKTTNNLRDIVEFASKGETQKLRKSIESFRLYHLEICRELFGEKHYMEEEIEKIIRIIQNNLYYTEFFKGKFNGYDYDQVLPYGEILASKIVNAFLKQEEIHSHLKNATEIIATDYNFGNADVNRIKTEEQIKAKLWGELQKEGTVIVTQGFIGRCEIESEDGNTKHRMFTTLGREGSDFSAGLLGNFLFAFVVVLWKNTKGVMDKDPNIAGGEDAKLITNISYERLSNLLEGTAKGLVHPKTIAEVRNRSILLSIKDFRSPEDSGTAISLLG